MKLSALVCRVFYIRWTGQKTTHKILRERKITKQESLTVSHYGYGLFSSSVPNLGYCNSNKTNYCSVNCNFETQVIDKSYRVKHHNNILK